MGLPYSRQINAAFEQVTPLVAAGFKVLRTTRDISILLAVIQVLTVFFLFLILVVLIALCYCVNPDLEHERKTLITPILRYIASISLYSLLKSLISSAIVFFLGLWLTYKLVVVKQWVADVEYEGNVRADLALEELADEELETEFPEYEGTEDGEREEEEGKEEKNEK